MRRFFAWVMVAILCCAAGGDAGQETPEALLREARADFDEAVKLKDAGSYPEALARAQQALALRERLPGDAPPDVASCLDLVGDLYWRDRNPARAQPLLQRALALREAALGGTHPLVAATLNKLANVSRDLGLNSQAEALHQRALAIREAALGKNHPDVAASLNNLANLYAEQGQYARAEAFHLRALAIREAALGESHPDVAQTLSNLANLYWTQGLYARAERLYQRALAIQEAALGKNHPTVAKTLNNLALVAVDQGLYGQAEPLYQRALAIREATFGKSHPEVAQTLGNLANLYWAQGLYDRAEALQQRTLAIEEKTLGPHHPVLAKTLHNLALVAVGQGRYERAEPLYQRALAIREAALGPQHPEVAQTLSNLAIVYADQGRYARAEPLFLRALAIDEKALGPHHPALASPLINLARLALQQGRYARAEPLFQRALALQEAALGPHHPDLSETLNLLARLRLAQHRLDSALPLFTRAFALSEQRLRQEALDFSESRLASFLQYLRADEQALYALLREHPEDARVRALALSAVLLLKGRSVDETADISRTLYRGLSAEDRDTLERLRGLRTQVATLSLAGPGADTSEDYPRRLKALADEGDALEADLAKRSAPLRARTALPLPGEMVGRVAAALPRDSALVEFIAYGDSPLVPPPGMPLARSPGPLRYLALVLFPDGSTRAVDLGPAAPIDAAATRLRGALACRDARYQEAAHALYRLAFQPLRPLLGSTRRLFLSPDGQLGLVPFAALHDGRRFLLDAFDFIYLTSGRELLPRPQDIPPATSVFVLADPDFSAAPREALSSASTRAAASPTLERFVSGPHASPSGGAWKPLPGTRQEAEGIQRLLPQAQLFLGPEATKERLLNLPTPGVLHLATHGFFLDDASEAPAGSRAVGHFGALGDNSPARCPREPLLRSGLVLAGARASTSQPDAALVTALELAGLNLWGTQLVVLSACDTGRGDVQLGQGVSGLRRALVVAGAETVVMSLWKVADDSTRQLMDTYYRNLLAGQGRASALRDAMRALRASRPHPHDWAPFIALGSDAPLRGITPAPPRPATPGPGAADAGRTGDGISSGP